MTALNSINKSQENNLNSLTKTVNQSGQQTQSASNFAQQLASATNTLNSPDLMNAAQTATSAFNNNALSSSGMSSDNFLSQTLQAGIKTQFNELGKDIAISLVEGFSGKSATETDGTTDDATKTTATEGATDTAEVTTAATEKTTTEKSEPADEANDTEEPESTEIPSTEEPQIASEQIEPATENFVESFLHLFDPLKNLFPDDEPVVSETDNSEEEQTTNTEEQSITDIEEQTSLT